MQYPLFEFDKIPLVSLSPGERFDRHRVHADKVSRLFKDGNDEYSWRILRCSRQLEFVQTESGLKLKNAAFCRVRTCPICQWRRSLMWQAKLISRLDVSQKLLFVTLTIKNCKIKRLGCTLDEMQQAWRRLMGEDGGDNRAYLESIGYIKSFEVTCPNRYSAHPHIHALIAVSEDYFIPIRKLVKYWRRFLKIQYDPVCHIRRCTSGALPEICKYMTKPSDLIKSRSWLLEYSSQVHRRRFIDCGGIFRRNYVEQEGNLIGLGEKLIAPLEGFPDLVFEFDDNLKRYVLEIVK